ncbi:MAG: GH25 family lysozyme [Bryobacteraceae bacterium]
MLIYGGVDGAGGCASQVGDTWLVTNANGLGGTPLWQEVSATGTQPPARNRASSVYDQAHSRMIVFGGASCDGFSQLLNDVWVLVHANGVAGTPTWTQLTPPEPLPVGRSQASAVYDPTANTMTVSGGCDDGIMDVPNDVWVLHNANGLGGPPTWTQLTPSGTPPAPRCSAVVTYSAPGNGSSIMTVYGGCCPSLGDLWILADADGGGSNPAWQQLSQSTPTPGPRQNAAFGYDSQANIMMFFGGSAYTPESTNYNDAWMLTDANDVRGTSSWVNTVANSMPGSPLAGNYGGVYDPVSKRLIVMQGGSPADLWVMTTRNGIDVSCGSGVPTPTELSQLQRDGILYAVVKAPQSDAGTCASGQIKTAQQQIDAFVGVGVKTAAYCFLEFDASFGPGDAQAQNCLNNITGNGADPGRLTALSFIALDVEGASTLTHQQARTLITQALNTLAQAPQRPIIYTDTGDWNTITGQSKMFSAYPLWLAASGVQSLTPFAGPFAGWTVLSGKQYQQGVTLSGLSPVDYDVFDPALFP